jgi:hypothetical protein
MSKKIVIIPVFCESHLIKFQVPNIIDTIDPDIIIYNEGMFPQGPESNTNVNNDFVKKYTLDGVRGFDFLELEKIIDNFQEQYPTKKIILNKMNYDGLSGAPECYYKACSNFEELDIKIEKGDFIFPFEGDVFHHEDSKEEIEEYMSQLEPDTGFKSNWIDFIETPYYCERSTLKPFIEKIEGRHRKVCLRYGTPEFYKDVLLNFMTQHYPMLYPTDLITYHYAWWRPEKFKELRYDQLNRPQEYWDSFEKGIQKIIKSKDTQEDVVIRPSRPPQQTHHWASFIDIEHPKHVKQHPNYVSNK